MELKVGFASGDWSSSITEKDGTPTMGGSGWIRIGQYSKHLTVPHVIGVLVFNNDLGIFGVTDQKGNHHFDCNVIYMQRWMIKGIPENIKIAKSNGQTIINDLDDWYWGLHDRHLAKSMVDPKNNKEENTDIYRKVLAASSLVVVSTPFLYKQAKNKLNVSDVEMLENHVDFDAFTPRQHNDDGITIIGWHGSTGHRSGDLEEVKQVFPQLPKERFCFHHTGHYGGHPTFWEETGVAQERVNLFPMVSPTVIGKMLPFDIGIAPLNDIPFNHAKSWIKPLEYAAAGIPFVMSKSPEYFRFKEKYGVGRIAKRYRNWIIHFEALSDPATRTEEAKRNLKALEALNVKQGALRLQKILESVR
tara:strand:- start:2945 stop:4024 length:1080 start_codon:yes stop_codon:yes gene_type:complete